MSILQEKFLATTIAVLTVTGLFVGTWQMFTIDSSEAKSIANEEAHKVVDTTFIRMGYEAKDMKKDIHSQGKDLDTIKAILKRWDAE
jgi:hypothetical protein